MKQGTLVNLYLRDQRVGTAVVEHVAEDYFTVCGLDERFPMEGDQYKEHVSGKWTASLAHGAKWRAARFQFPVR